jgi:hypothetical protein
MDKNLIARTSVIIDSTTEKVWDALVNPEGIKLYMFAANVFSNWLEQSRFSGSGSGKVNRMKTKASFFNLSPVDWFNTVISARLPDYRIDRKITAPYSRMFFASALS